MKKEFKEVILNDNKIYINQDGYHPAWSCKIKDVVIDISDGVLTLTGNQVENDLFIQSKYTETDLYEPESVKYGYKNPVDFILRKKSPYIEGWATLKQTKKVVYTFSNWQIIEI